MSLNHVSPSQHESEARSRFSSWETKVEEVLEGGLEEAWQLGNERLRSRFRFWFLFCSLRSSILQRCLSIGNSISYIITKDVWYGILCHGLSLCALSDCATLVIEYDCCFPHRNEWVVFFPVAPSAFAKFRISCSSQQPIKKFVCLLRGKDIS